MVHGGGGGGAKGARRTTAAERTAAIRSLQAIFRTGLTSKLAASPLSASAQVFKSGAGHTATIDRGKIARSTHTSFKVGAKMTGAGFQKFGWMRVKAPKVYYAHGGTSGRTYRD